MLQSRFCGKQSSAAAVLSAFLVTTVLLVLSPAAMATPSRTATEQVQAETIEIDGPAVTVAVSSELVRFTYDYDGVGQVAIEFLDCPEH